MSDVELERPLVDCRQCSAKSGQSCWGKRPDGRSYGAIAPHLVRRRDARQASASPPPSKEPPMPDGSVSTPSREVLALDLLIFDRAMQCRVALDEATVTEYAEAHTAGATFPPLKVVRVDERDYFVVDGFHRGAALRRNRVALIDCEVVDGTRRDALLMAVRANSDHGLRRTVKDKRRAVDVLLMDQEWCKLSGRDAAKLAGVTHTYVNQLRTYYCVERGERLTEARHAEVTGELTLRWRDIYEGTQEYQRADLEKIRTARTVVDLVKVKLGTCGTKVDKAKELRREELATADWPWPEDGGLVGTMRRWRRLDTVKDIAAALGSEGFPPDLRAEGYELLGKAVTMPTDNWERERVRKAFAGRALLVAAFEAKCAKYDAKSGRGVVYAWDLARAVSKLPTAQEQIAALEQLDDDAFPYIEADDLLPEVREGAYRTLVAPGGGAPCVDPVCAARGGWVVEGTKNRHPHCWACSAHPHTWAQRVEQELVKAGLWLDRPGVGVRVHVGPVAAVVDADAVRLLAELEQIDPLQVDEGNAEVLLRIRRALVAWRVSVPALVMADTRPAAAAEGA